MIFLISHTVFINVNSIGDNRWGRCLGGETDHIGQGTGVGVEGGAFSDDLDTWMNRWELSLYQAAVEGELAKGWVS
jgi:hypothetical protein